MLNSIDFTTAAEVRKAVATKAICIKIQICAMPPRKHLEREINISYIACAHANLFLTENALICNNRLSSLPILNMLMQDCDKYSAEAIEYAIAFIVKQLELNNK
jgi:hypothetical protein